jgi:transmembrane sensor
LKDLHQEKELIKKILSGKASPEEQHQLSRLMKQPGFRALFNAVLDEQGGELEMELDEQAQAFTNEKLELFYQHLPQEPMEAPVVTLRRPLWKKMLPYAAAVVTAVSGLFFWLGNNEKVNNIPVAQEIDKKNGYPVPVESTVQYIEHYNQGKRRLKVKLADGSMVTLGRRGRIKYPAGFAGDARDVYLEGEAFFEVVKNAGKPFTVFTGDVHTQVLGTSFKVSALQGSAVEVAVVTGKVKVSYHGGKMENDLATMLPGDKISWKNSHLTKLKMDPKDVLAWKNEMMVFRKQSLDNILDAFRKHYGVNITVINKGFLTEKISLTLDERMPLEKAMNVLSVTAGFDHSFDPLSRTVIIR